MAEIPNADIFENKGNFERLRKKLEDLIPGLQPANNEPNWEFSSRENIAVETPYSGTILREFDEPEFRKFFADFKDQIVVDLGAGQTSNTYTVASISGAGAYVGVEPHFFPQLESQMAPWLEEYLTEEKGTQAIPFALVDDDALHFLRRLPDRSVSIFVSGLDSFVIKDDQYKEAVNKEIQRVLNPNGAFIKYDSVFTLDQDRFNEESAENTGGSQFLARPEELIKYKVKS